MRSNLLSYEGLCSGEAACGLIRLVSVELVLVRSIGGKEYIDLQVGRRSWRREGAAGRMDMVVECRQEGGRKTED